MGVGCFIKAIRLAQHTNPELKTKIKSLVGIICGGVKSRFFTEYLANRASVPTDLYYKPEFRIKDTNSTAGDYSFGCYDKKTKKFKSIKMRTVGDMWGTGLFKNNACDFCDDVTTELADISLGDAWLQPYVQDGFGTNILVTRSAIAEKIINQGIDSGNLILDKLIEIVFLSSQQGSYNHRHNGLKFRIKKRKEKGLTIPPKRQIDYSISYDFKLVQILRSHIRMKSLIVWKNTKDYKSFDSKIGKDLFILKKSTLLYHYNKAIINRIKKILK